VSVDESTALQGLCGQVHTNRQAFQLAGSAGLFSLCPSAYHCSAALSSGLADVVLPTLRLGKGLKHYPVGGELTQRGLGPASARRGCICSHLFTVSREMSAVYSGVDTDALTGVAFALSRARKRFLLPTNKLLA
jgi:hypothetical protein